MKIVLLHTDFRIYWPARIKALNTFLESLRHILFVIEIAGKGSPYSFANQGTIDHSLNWHILFPDQAAEEVPSIVSQKAIADKLKELNPDVVVAGAIAYQSGTAALKWKDLTGKPVIIFDDARPLDVKRNGFINLIKRNLYSQVDAVFCPAHSHSMGFIHWGFQKEQIFYGVDVVDNEIFNKKGSVHQLQQSFIMPPQPYLLAIGRQIDKKNWHCLITAFIDYKKTNLEGSLNLVFIGDGPLHLSLVGISETENRKDIFFVPFVQQSEIVQYYHHAKGLILPSRYGETWGLVVNEAMAAGLPVLVSKECGCSQTLVNEGINGWTFNPAHAVEISGAIGKLDNLTQEQWDKMSLASTSIIKDWGLSRFTKGVLDALIFVSTKPKSKMSLQGKMLLKFWNGRYRPV